MALLLCERKQNWLRVVTVVSGTIGIYDNTSTVFFTFFTFFQNPKKSWLFTFFAVFRTFLRSMVKVVQLRWHFVHKFVDDSKYPRRFAVFDTADIELSRFRRKRTLISQSAHEITTDIWQIVHRVTSACLDGKSDRLIRLVAIVQVSAQLKKRAMVENWAMDRRVGKSKRDGALLYAASEALV